MNIYEKLLNITNEMKTVAKNLEVGIGKNSYKAVKESDVLKAVKELEAKHKVYSYPSNRKILESSVLQTRKEYQGQVTEGNQIFMRIETTYTFINVDKPDEKIEIITYGDGLDNGDKAPGKAMTYADKYALLKAYKIISGEDIDSKKSPDNANYKKIVAEEDIQDKLVTDKEVQMLLKLLKQSTETGTQKNIENTLKKYKKGRLEDLMMTEYVEIIHYIEDLKKKQKQSTEGVF